MVLSGGLAVAGALGLALGWRASWPLLAVGGAILAGFSVIGHKETRFVFMLTPIWLIGLAALAADRGGLLAAAVPRMRRAAPAVAGVLVAGFAVISMLGLVDRLPGERRYLRPNIARNPARDAYRALAVRGDVIAVLDASGASGWYSPPYYDLHHDVPLDLAAQQWVSRCRRRAGALRQPRDCPEAGGGAGRVPRARTGGAGW